MVTISRVDRSGAIEGDFRHCASRRRQQQISDGHDEEQTVYSLARELQSTSMEELRHNSSLTSCRAAIQPGLIRIDPPRSTLWRRLTIDGEKPHPSASCAARGGTSKQPARALAGRKLSITSSLSGLRHLVLLPTAHSSFRRLHHDSLTLCPETKDRLFGTLAAVLALAYTIPNLDFEADATKIRETMLPHLCQSRQQFRGSKLSTRMASSAARQT